MGFISAQVYMILEAGKENPMRFELASKACARSDGSFILLTSLATVSLQLPRPGSEGREVRSCYAQPEGTKHCFPGDHHRGASHRLLLTYHVSPKIRQLHNCLTSLFLSSMTACALGPLLNCLLYKHIEIFCWLSLCFMTVHSYKIMF